MISLQNIHNNFVPVRLEFLSPVHIGSGEMLSPLEYQIFEEQSGQYIVYTIDFDGWINSLTPDEAKAVASKFSLSNQTQIWEYLRNTIDRNVFIKIKSKTNEEIHQKYKVRLKGTNKSENELAPAIRNAYTSAIVIPGSSIKGAIRTAIIDYRYKKELKQAYRMGTTYGKESWNYEAELEHWFGDIKENAFKQLKVSDFELLPDESEFVQAVQYAKNNPEERLMNPVCEVAPIWAKPKYGKIYLGSFTAHEYAKKTLEDWTFENLCKVCNQFYLKRFNAEYEKFYKLPHFVQARNFIDGIRNKVQTENALLLRIGHYSHVECVTVENAAPKTRPNPKTKKPMPFGTTRTLADGKYPFGWVLLHKCFAEDAEQGKMQEEQARQEIIANLQARKALFLTAKNTEYEAKQKLLSAQRKQEEQARKAREEALRLQKEQEQKEAEKLSRKQAEQAQKEAEEQRLASLSPEERLVELVLLKKAGKEEVLKVYERIDSLDNKIQIAEAIRAFWQKEKIWSGKLKENQKIRVDKIMAILRAK